MLSGTPHPMTKVHTWLATVYPETFAEWPQAQHWSQIRICRGLVNTTCPPWLLPETLPHPWHTTEALPAAGQAVAGIGACAFCGPAPGQVWVEAGLGSHGGLSQHIQDQPGSYQLKITLWFLTGGPGWSQTETDIGLYWRPSQEAQSPRAATQRVSARHRFPRGNPHSGVSPRTAACMLWPRPVLTASQPVGQSHPLTCQ